MSAGKDREMLRFVVDCGVVNVAQLAAAFSVSAQMVCRRIVRMEKAGWVRRLYSSLAGRKGRPESLIVVGSEGAKVLKQDLGRLVDIEVDTPRIPHQLHCNWFRIRLLAIEGEDLSVRFISEASPLAVDTSGRELLRFEGADSPGVPGRCRFVPDAAFSLTSKKASKSLLFFVEVDMGTESLVNGKGTDISQKIRNYRQFRAGGGYQRCEELFEAKFHGFRVLFVADTAKRRDKLCELVEAMAPADFVWVTDHATLMDRGAGAPIWVRGGRRSDGLFSILGRLEENDE